MTRIPGRSLRFDLVTPNADALRQLLATRQLSQAKLLNKAATNRKTLSNILTGRQNRVTSDTVKALADALNELRREGEDPVRPEDLIQPEPPAHAQPGTT